MLGTQVNTSSPPPPRRMDFFSSSSRLTDGLPAYHLPAVSLFLFREKFSRGAGEVWFWNWIELIMGDEILLFAIGIRDIFSVSGRAPQGFKLECSLDFDGMNCGSIWKTNAVSWCRPSGRELLKNSVLFVSGTSKRFQLKGPWASLVSMKANDTKAFFQVQRSK